MKNQKSVTLSLKRLRLILTTKFTKNHPKTEEIVSALVGKSDARPVHIGRRVWKECAAILAVKPFVVLHRRKNGVMILREAKIKAHFGTMNAARLAQLAKARAAKVAKRTATVAAGGPA